MEHSAPVVDDYLTAPTTEEDCKQWTESLLSGPHSPVYRVSSKKAEFCVPQVMYLGYNLEERKQKFSHDCISAILQISAPTLTWAWLDTVGYV